MIQKNSFFQKYNILDSDFLKTKLKWEDLIAIYEDYEKCIPHLEQAAIFVFNSLMKIQGVHSVRYRIKDPEHLIEKIIRKKIEDPNRKSTLADYKNDITDLIGLRALHLFKEDWFKIHTQIEKTWGLKDTPTAYYRKGDSEVYLKNFEEKGCITKEHPHTYRSVHYSIETKPTKETFLAEIQVRTIFEEAWSEIDHTIRYPYNTGNRIYNEFLMILNRLVGSADEMGTFINRLQQEWNSMDRNFTEVKNDRESTIIELEKKIQELGIKDQQIEDLKIIIRKLKTENIPTLIDKYNSILSGSDHGGIESNISSILQNYVNEKNLSNLRNSTNSSLFNYVDNLNKNLYKDTKL